MFEILGEENLKATDVQTSIHSTGVHLTQSCSLSYLEATSQLTTASHSPCSLWEPKWLLAFGFEKSRKSVLKKKKTKQNNKPTKTRSDFWVWRRFHYKQNISMSGCPAGLNYSCPVCQAEGTFLQVVWAITHFPSLCLLSHKIVTPCLKLTGLKNPTQTLGVV